jgi:hypothetical protein
MLECVIGKENVAKVPQDENLFVSDFDFFTTFVINKKRAGTPSTPLPRPSW